MKNLILSLVAFFATTALFAQQPNLEVVKSYAMQAMPRCPGSTIEVQPINRPGPAGFLVYGVTQQSSDEYCGSQRYLLVSPKTQQTFIGSVLSLPNDGRPLHQRVTEFSSERLKAKLTARIAPLGLPDGLKTVTMTKETPYGMFGYSGYIDGSESFLLIGLRGNLKENPGKTLKNGIGSSNAVRRGSLVAKTEIIEISDFQCPTCGRAHTLLEPLISKNLDKINYARIDLPLFEHHQWSLFAALGARAIQRVAPAKYWRYVDSVFKNQDLIGTMKFDTFLKNFCEDNDISWKAIEKIYLAQSERQALLEQAGRILSTGINSTPTFIINGQVMGFGPEGSYTISAIKSAIGVK